tara:strand:+ start:240 stop:443 length:204 start_codon:yes stop_codon:yes gene_type:complete
MSDSNKKDIRYDISERITWALFRQDQLDLGLMIDSHYKKITYLTLDEREAVCVAWNFLETESKLTDD